RRPSSAGGLLVAPRRSGGRGGGGGAAQGRAHPSRQGGRAAGVLGAGGPAPPPSDGRGAGGQGLVGQLVHGRGRVQAGFLLDKGDIGRRVVIVVGRRVLEDRVLDRQRLVGGGLEQGYNGRHAGRLVGEDGKAGALADSPVVGGELAGADIAGVVVA